MYAKDIRPSRPPTPLSPPDNYSGTAFRGGEPQLPALPSSPLPSAPDLSVVPRTEAIQPRRPLPTPDEIRQTPAPESVSEPPRDTDRINAAPDNDRINAAPDNDRISGGDTYFRSPPDTGISPDGVAEAPRASDRRREPEPLRTPGSRRQGQEKGEQRPPPPKGFLASLMPPGFTGLSPGGEFGFEELLLVGLIFLLSQSENDNDILMMLALLLFYQ